MSQTQSTIDTAEVERFSRLAQEWWNPTGKFKPLHKFNPVRLAYIRDQVAKTFGRDAAGLRPFEGLRMVDIGCGGGLIAEPLARLGAEVVGVDASATNIEVARLHAAESGLAIDYRAETAEALAAAEERFDVVLALEIVEHVADVDFFLRTTASLVKPGGLLVVATINRTLKAFGLAIVGAEYVLGWLPKGTHQFSKLVRPGEVRLPLTAEGLDVVEETGVVYHPLADEWRRSEDIDVNYMVLARRPA
ncbi:bifunctional 2-polyprenyl-6-hydroxyphenol methylase/3-demethylubiquinol 3-O-methyltransferase UbiG [Mangrovibrevibacter kandeliae]|uniref:bifunctional 2-polyprenyl-6-hydroxyphenol methylase/3-demethylubiquinol 3-O-methyltransferase UbiG n=1 Tax=Mangrovibrevibacter kandeliae TaxID=2968473 RepID=UPI00211911A9|nr:bifunctional 2-polyprenyl-6-hydroxyphenol methylase/3-demethylubiquinol 3-O-methyltransferase UbiG [Aurantimonas sp. CSK15Z-1]MCQ8783903.1 bifunctional 2-polyprenyl-6-hydroxyphenol methylase/3-demethylubiquinol 3-O-methyltransferase UbiG [Aurantimonas sp. CSK15Z-1]